MTPEIGYNIHHVNEQTPAEQDGYSRWMIDAPENLVRIPTLKHWEITGWYMTSNEDYGGLSPRAYLRGKSWEERRRVGIDALIQHKVLIPAVAISDSSYAGLTRVSTFESTAISKSWIAGSSPAMTVRMGRSQ
ncbi:MAG: hypothetical protein ACXWVL_06520 [Rhodoplanes sp.]|jgi:hypothetical protein